jgi:hypothetical protein
VSGLQEILVIVLIIVALWTVPRLMDRGREQRPSSFQRHRLHGKTRLAILGSAVWVGGSGLIFNPLEGPYLPFVLIGLCPVALGWGAAWVVRGYRKGR